MSTPKVKLGIGDNMLDLLGIGNVSRIAQHPIKTVGRRKIAGGEVLLPELGHAETLYVLEGYINTDVETNLAKLRNLFTAQKPVWLETSRFYAAGKITDLELPHGPEPHTRYRIELAEIPFWGRTIINSGDEAYLADLDFAYKKKDILSPLWGRYNFQLDRVNKKFSWELILVNELEETGSFSAQWDDDQAANGYWTATADGTGTVGIPTLSDVTNPTKKNNNALKITVGTGTYANWKIYHTFSPAVDWSGYDFLTFWFYGLNSGKTFKIELRTGTGNWRTWTFTDDFTGWGRIVKPLKTGDEADIGTVDLTIVDKIYISQYGGTTGTWYLDRGGVDVGNWVKLEIQVPDTLTDTSEWDYKLYAWGGTGYVVNAAGDGFLGVGKGGADFIARSRLYWLDGTTADKVYAGNFDAVEAYPQDERGNTKTGYWGVGSITYSQTYGCKHRVGFAVKMPPWTGSNDLTGKFAINKAKLKIEVYYDKEDTTFID